MTKFYDFLQRPLVCTVLAIGCPIGMYLGMTIENIHVGLLAYAVGIACVIPGAHKLARLS